MFTVVLGGAASGKSEYAENLARRLAGRRIYIATMQPFDDECVRRIARHQAMRADKGFATVECYTGLAGVTMPADANVLLECMSNLVANEMYSPDGGGTAAVLAGLEALIPQCRNLTVVTNEVFLGGSRYEGDTLSYLQALSQVNRWMAARADAVVQVICGLARPLKGELLYGMD